MHTQCFDKKDKSWAERLVLLLILGAFFGLGIYYAKDNPIYIKPDEFYHHAYVNHLRLEKALPVIDVTKLGPGNHAPVEMEGHQPPLYYTTISFITSLFGLYDRVSLTANPHFLGTLYGNRNPWTPAYAALTEAPVFFTGRFISLVCGMLALIFAYLLCRLFLPWPLAALSVAFMGFNPQFLFIATSFSNDMMAVAATHAGLWQLGKIMQKGLNLRKSIVLGIIVALATLIKLTGLGLLIPLGIIALWQAWKSRKGWPLIWASVSGLIVLLLDSWWFWRNWVLYRNPFATNLLPILLGPRVAPWSSNDFWFFVDFLWKAYWVDFSPGGILFAEPKVYVIIGLICILAGIGLILALVRERSLLPFFLLIWGWFALVTVSLFQLTSKTAFFMGGGRLLFPSAIAISATLAVGLTKLCRNPILPGGLALLLGIFAVIAPLRYIYPAYPKPILMKSLETHPKYLLGVRFGNEQFELLGYGLEQTEVFGKRALKFTYYWHALKRTDRNFSVFLHLETWEREQPRVLAQIDTYPGYGVWPTSSWRPDCIFVDSLILPLPTLGQSFSGVVLTGLYFLPTMERLPAYDRAGQRLPGDAVPLARIWTDVTGNFHLTPSLSLEFSPRHLLGARFGDEQFELIGYDLEQVAMSGQRYLAIVYYWRALERTDRNYSVFIHLETKEKGQPVVLTQTDTYPGYGMWPTSAWRPGCILVDRLVLPLPPPGQSFSGIVFTGLYFPPTMERLPAYDQAGQRFPDDAVPLAQVWADASGNLRIVVPQQAK